MKAFLKANPGSATITDAGSDMKKRSGCLALACVLFALWAAGAWVLWYWSINAPMPPGDEEKSMPFEFMPRAEGS